MCYVSGAEMNAILVVLERLTNQKRTFSGYQVKQLVAEEMKLEMRQLLNISAKVRELFNQGDKAFENYACTKGPEYNGVRPLFYFYLPKNIRERIGLE